MSAIKTPVTDLIDGVYFEMHEDEYHAIPRLSASGIANMLVSPATFWAKSWLNPDREDDDDDTPARVTGRAYHCARLEPDRFFDTYAPDLDKADLEEDCLMTDTAIKAALKDLGLTQALQGEGVLERAARLRDAGYPGQILHLEQAAADHDRGDRTALPRKVWREIRRDMAAIKRSPEVLDHLTGGAAEVSILWTDPANGVKMKARFDYLKPASFTDFKTFDNSTGRHLEQALVSAFRFNRYYIQAATYWQAFEAIRAGAIDVVRHFSPDHVNLIRAIRQGDEPGRCFYVFQEKNGIPNILVREFGIRTGHASLRMAAADDAQFAESVKRFGNFSQIYRKAEAEIAWAQRTFTNMQEIYPAGSPWFPINATGRIDDESFPMSFLESEW
jgi:D-alanyl-D-alanine dipeptidase